MFFDDFPGGEHDASPRRRIGHGPLDDGAAAQLQCRATTEVHEQHRRRWIARKIAERLEHVVARVVREHDRPVVDHGDETGAAAAMRCVRSGLGVNGGKERRVGARDPLAMRRRE